MKQFADALTVCLLFIIIIQDLCHRQISWVTLPLLFIALGLSAAQNPFTWKSVIVNLVFLLVQFLLLSGYYFLTHGSKVKIIDSKIGLGDVLLLVTLCIAFSPVNFILFYVLSLVLSLAGFISYRFIFRNTNPHLPLAATISICLALALAIKNIYHLDFYNDSMLVKFLGDPS